MIWIQYLIYLWALVISQVGFVCSDIRFLKRHEGESVVLPCETEPGNPAPYSVYLKRTWLHPMEVLFMYTKEEFSTGNDADKNRTSVSGDPSLRVLNVTISQLKASDTDRYYCEFVVENRSSKDDRITGKTEFFLLVGADVPGSADIEVIETCAGGSAVLPCLPHHGESLAVEGVALKRQKGRGPVEVLYHSKQRHSSRYSSSSQFPVERVQLSSAPGPGGITYNLTLQQLQPDDSALYSCQLLQRGEPDSCTSLGRRVFFISVQGGQWCGCSSYSSLLYALSSAVGLLLLLLLIVFVVMYKGKGRRRVNTHPQAPIYEEMKSPTRKGAPLHLEGIECSEYRNCPAKRSSSENHYEIPRAPLTSPMN
ncbi:cd7 antigen-like [Archocentrus centrarchus]|uniref:cd7 antigen-like n=1 Tax=Archocentrus centrarchus TaxID=63155 RepID=UPI0011E9E381|nr:uncharacterized protein LOC115787385 [Archocentrus centrarchus]